MRGARSRRGQGARAAVAGLAILGVVLGAAALSCGAAFTAAPTGGSDASTIVDGAVPIEPADAAAAQDGGDAGTDAADAGLRFCDSQDAAHTLCEDFAANFPDKFTEVMSGGGLVQSDRIVTRSPPQSLLAITPALPAMGQSATAVLTHDFPGAAEVGVHFTLQDWVQFDGDGGCFKSDTDGVTIAALTFPESPSHYEIGIIASSGGAAIVEVTAPDGGGGTVTPHAFSVEPFVFDTFVPWIVDLNLTVTKLATVTIGGTQVYKDRLTAAPAGEDFDHPTLLLGASVKNVSDLSTGCKVHVDDILFDIGAL